MISHHGTTRFRRQPSFTLERDGLSVHTASTESTHQILLGCLLYAPHTCFRYESLYTQSHTQSRFLLCCRSRSRIYTGIIHGKGSLIVNILGYRRLFVDTFTRDQFKYTELSWSDSRGNLTLASTRASSNLHSVLFSSPENPKSWIGVDVIQDSLFTNIHSKLLWLLGTPPSTFTVRGHLDNSHFPAAVSLFFFLLYETIPHIKGLCI